MRLQPVDEIDIRWFAQDASESFGLRCGMGFQLERARAGQLFDMGTVADKDMDRQVIALRRFERIRACLLAMTSADRQTLFAAYCSDRPPTLRKLDRLGPVCMLTGAALKAYGRHQAATLAKSRGERSDGLLAQERTKHFTLAAWLGPKMSSSPELRDAVLTEADAKLTQACRSWYTSTSVQERTAPWSRSLRIGLHGSTDDRVVFRRSIPGSESGAWLA